MPDRLTVGQRFLEPLIGVRVPIGQQYEPARVLLISGIIYNMNNFWDEWGDINELEKKAISSLLKAKELILKTIPKDNIFAIYVKGSMIQRGLKQESDVDIAVMLSDDTYLNKLYELNDKEDLFEMPVQFVAYTLEELKTGNFPETRIKKPTPVSRFAKHLGSYKLIYGKPLDIKNIFTRTDFQHLRSSIDFFNDFFIPDYESGKFKFQNLLKQVFWLTEDELRYKGMRPAYSWRNMANYIDDKNHIIYTALKLREHEYSIEEENEFMVNLKNYLKELKGYLN